MKHNDNGGKVMSNNETALSFTHFTFEASNHEVVVVDIQGVKRGSHYTWTDPQIHSREGIEKGNIADGSGFASGNFGQDGMKKFVRTHKCNAVCKRLQLPEVQEEEVEENSKWASPQKEIWSPTKASRPKPKGWDAAPKGNVQLPADPAPPSASVYEDKAPNWRPAQDTPQEPCAAAPSQHTACPRGSTPWRRYLEKAPNSTPPAEGVPPPHAAERMPTAKPTLPPFRAAQPEPPRPCPEPREGPELLSNIRFAQAGFFAMPDKFEPTFECENVPPRHAPEAGPPIHMGPHTDKQQGWRQYLKEDKAPAMPPAAEHQPWGAERFEKHFEGLLHDRAGPTQRPTYMWEEQAPGGGAQEGLHRYQDQAPAMPRGTPRHSHQEEFVNLASETAFFAGPAERAFRPLFENGRHRAPDGPAVWDKLHGMDRMDSRLEEIRMPVDVPPPQLKHRMPRVELNKRALGGIMFGRPMEGFF